MILKLTQHNTFLCIEKLITIQEYFYRKRYLCGIQKIYFNKIIFNQPDFHINQVFHELHIFRYQRYNAPSILYCKNLH